MRSTALLLMNPARARPWVWALGLVLLAHGALLMPRWRPQSPAGQPKTMAVALQTRPAPAVVPPTPAPKPAAPALSPKPADTPPAPLPQATAEPSPIGEPAPPTAIAPAAEWRYLLRQNGREGEARLSWQPQDGGYQLRLERKLDGRALPGWRSEGRLDGQGLAPQRYAQQRRQRDTQATNFRREEGLISFSASTELVALPTGVQDRISWWVQLAALVAGAPQRFGPGREIRLPVVGMRGEPREWVFEVVGEEALALPLGVVASSLHLRRAAIGPYDGGIDVWLDPARGHLPVRLVAGALEERGWELQLVDDNVKP